MVAYREATAAELDRARRNSSSRSQLVGVLAFALLIVGLLFGTYSILIPALLGLGLLSATGRFLSMRLNPFTPSFYIPTKPSWLSIGMLAICGLLLISSAWELWRNGLGPILPGHVPG